MKIILSFLTFTILSISPAVAKHSYLEKDYQNYWCKLNNGISEYTLNDRTRIDCLTKEYAIEFDFANKWAESIGQALYYALYTGKKAGVVLILENPKKDIKYLNRLNCVAKKYNIRVWTITAQELDFTSVCRK